MMDQLIADFPAQLQKALEIGASAQLSKAQSEIRNIVVTGLGGSGMGANIVQDLLKNRLEIPMLINKTYHLPAFVDQHTLLIASSYSGNTEETLMALHQAIKQKAQIVCISSGGKMKAIAEKHQLNFIALPAHQPSPRACLGYSFIQQLFILHYFGFLDTSFVAQIKKAIDLLQQQKESIQKETMAWAKQLANKIPIIYAPEGYAATAIRWRQQFNENGKMLAWHHVLPEMNHNELVGWRTKNAQFAPIFFETSDTFSRTAYRLRVSKEVISQYTPHTFSIPAKGDSHLERMLYLIHFGDWLSWYLAQERGFDASEVDVIDYLKGLLAKEK